MTAAVVGVTIVRNQAAAEVLCGMLRANGIKCAYRQTNFGAGAMDGMPGGAQEIVVAGSDVQRAQALIEAPSGSS